MDISLAFEWLKQDNWLIWDEENELETFQLNEMTIGINFNAVFADKHEFRLKLEAVVIEAEAAFEFEALENGQLQLADDIPDSFSLSECAVQLRYRYEISPLSSLFIVYGRGGEYEVERLGFNRFSLINKSIDRDEDESLLVKLRMHF